MLTQPLELHNTHHISSEILLMRLVQMRAQAERILKTDTLTAELKAIINNYMDTRSHTGVAADKQALSDRLYTLQQIQTVCNYLDRSVKNVQDAINSFKPTGGSTQEVTVGYSDFNKRTMTSVQGQRVDSLLAGQTTTESAIGILSGLAPTIAQWNLNKVKKEISDVESVEALATDANKLIEIVETLVAKIERIRNGSQARVAEAERLYKATVEASKADFIMRYSRILETHIPEADLAAFNQQHQTQYRPVDLLRNRTLKHQLLEWKLQEINEEATQALDAVKAAEKTLCEKVDEAFVKVNLEEFKSAIKADRQALNGITRDQAGLSQNTELVQLARAAGFDPLSFVIIANQVPKLNASLGRISPAEQTNAIQALKDGLQKYISIKSERSISGNIAKLYLMAKLDKRLRAAGVSAEQIGQMAKTMGLPEGVVKIFQQETNGQSLKELVGKGNSSVFIKVYERMRETNAKITGSNIVNKDEVKQKAMVALVYYAYQKLCNHDNISAVDRMQVSPRTRFLKQVAIEIVKETLGDSRTPDMDELFEYLSSPERDQAFIIRDSTILKDKTVFNETPEPNQPFVAQLDRFTLARLESFRAAQQPPVVQDQEPAHQIVRAHSAGF